MQDASNTKQLIVEKVRQATNILVAVNANPSVDGLAAALALTLMINKLDKHGAAVFSGQLPQAMQFLEPGKTFDTNVDSLRDFIISLDKEKADRLRYKVEDDVVRIFITPYKTTITEKDLQFSQGDFNVELIVCLGVEKREDLDKAIVAHGRILHDATVVTINANNQQSSLGAVDWHDPQASSMCEMLISLSEAFQKPGLLDPQIATALLTGLVAATDRFSNQQTSPRVMTMAAQLMAAGANQQLVANNLRVLQDSKQPMPQVVEKPKQGDAAGQLSIEHQKAKNEKAAEAALAAALPAADKPAAPTMDELKQAIDEASPKPESQTKHAFISESQSKVPGGDAVGMMDDSQGDAPSVEETPMNEPSWRGRKLQPPTMGGSLSATAQDALDDKVREDEDVRNKTLLNHFDEAAGVKAEAPKAPAFSKAPSDGSKAPTISEIESKLEESQPVPDMPALPIVDPGQPAPAPEPVAPAASVEPPAPTPEPAPPAPPAPVAPPTPEPTPAPSTVDVDAARQAVDAALAAQPFSPAGNPAQAVAAQPMPQIQPLPDLAPAPAAQTTPLSSMVQAPALPPAPVAPPPPAAAAEPGSLPPIPPMPPLPQFDANGLPPMPPTLPADQPLPPLTPPTSFDQTPPPPAPPAPNDPRQFKIPGQ